MYKNKVMKNLKFIFLPAILFTLIACDNGESVQDESQTEPEENVSYASFGDSITADNAISSEEMVSKYENLEQGDTIDVKFTGIIENVCQKKGCWMNLKLNEDQTAFVRFKDYGFFMPFNAAESEAIVNGKAFISVVSIGELKHYAEDEEKSQEEIDAIVEPEITYGFLADGVLIKE